MKVLYTGRNEHQANISKILGRGTLNIQDQEIRRQVWDILEAVRIRGDQALFEYADRFDHSRVTSKNLRIKPEEIEHQVQAHADPQITASLEHSADRIRFYHSSQKMEPFQLVDQNGMKIMQRILPLSRVGIYVPGGQAKYPTSVLMSAIPARLAGVQEIAMVTPAPDNQPLDPHVIAAARIAGITEIYRVGGAHSIAALAYGTESIRKVDKIVGPGNIYVDTAKRLVYGTVDIDMTAGPSEALIIADQSAEPAYIAADLIAQAEHDQRAQSILLLIGSNNLKAILDQIESQLLVLERSQIAEKALEDNGAIIICNDLAEALRLSNYYAPEHLQIIIKDPRTALSGIVNAGSVFIGQFSPAALGDYVAGPNHVLPTGGSARFFSGLSVYDFIKRMSVTMCSKEALAVEGEHLIRLATAEHLTGHARSVAIRFQKH